MKSLEERIIDLEFDKHQRENMSALLVGMVTPLVDLAFKKLLKNDDKDECANTETPIQREFKVGDKVYDLMRGDGVVVKIKEESYYPVVVMHSCHTGGEISYTENGQFFLSANRTLFHLDTYKEDIKRIFDIK